VERRSVRVLVRLAKEKKRRRVRKEGGQRKGEGQRKGGCLGQVRWFAGLPVSRFPFPHPGAFGVAQSITPH